MFPYTVFGEACDDQATSTDLSGFGSEAAAAKLHPLAPAFEPQLLQLVGNSIELELFEYRITNPAPAYQHSY